MSRYELEMKLKSLVAEMEAPNNGFHYRADVNHWQNYGKDRFYFAIIETRDCSKHYKKISYGYWDNDTETYHPEKYNRLA